MVGGSLGRGGPPSPPNSGGSQSGAAPGASGRAGASRALRRELDTSSAWTCAPSRPIQRGANGALRRAVGGRRGTGGARGWPGNGPARTLTLTIRSASQHGERRTAACPSWAPAVLELGHIVAGPTAALILADLGADVDQDRGPDGGDQARRMPRRRLRLLLPQPQQAQHRARPEGAAGQGRLPPRWSPPPTSCSTTTRPARWTGWGWATTRLAALNPRLVYLSRQGLPARGRTSTGRRSTSWRR